MVILIVLASVAMGMAAIPAFLYFRNLSAYRPPPPFPPSEGPLDYPHVSVLIPARNEESSIGKAVEAARTSRNVIFEVLVYDDHSEDGTADVVKSIAARDDRVRLVSGSPLPPGWCGKQHACAQLAGEARHEVLIFVDADVRLSKDAASRMAAFLEESGSSLASGIPREETGTLLEKLLIPLIHFLLLGFLPLRRMRASRNPSYGAGCGQLFVARGQDYFRAGGHGAVRSTLHDGVKLPRAFRKAGFRTDLFDATELASCRMYRSAAEVWRGLAKNATEGLATPSLIVPASILLLGGQVLPFVLLGCRGFLSRTALILSLIAAALSVLPRLSGVFRFHHSLAGAILHPLGILIFLANQWYALGRRLLGGQSSWKGRAYPAPDKQSSKASGG